MLQGFDLIKGGDVMIGIPVKDFGAANNLGAFASMRSAKTLHCLLLLAAGTGVEHVTVELQQAQDGAATGVKVLPISKLYYKAGADLAAIKEWTEVTAISRQAKVNSWVSSDAGAATLQLAVMIRIDEDDLDTNAGFTHVRLKLDDPGAARQGTQVFIAGQMAYQGLNKDHLLV